MEYFRPANLLERDSNVGVFLLESFLKNLYEEIFWTDIRKCLFEISVQLLSDAVRLQKYQSLSNCSFEHN